MKSDKVYQDLRTFWVQHESWNDIQMIYGLQKIFNAFCAKLFNLPYKPYHMYSSKCAVITSGAPFANMVYL